MGFTCGIVGLPNVGKSTVFNALAQAHAAVANYPFCTKEPNRGVVAVPDERLDKLHSLFPEKKKVPTTIEFLDIAGLVKGASNGEGLGNQFLAEIREVDAILHIVRLFESENVSHVYSTVDPIRDIEIIKTELFVKDLEAVTKRMEKEGKLARAGDKKAQAAMDALAKVRGNLEKGISSRQVSWNEEEKTVIDGLFLLTSKPVLYLLNVADKDLPDGGEAGKKIRALAEREGAGFVILAAEVEAELGELSEEEKKEYVKEFHFEESGLKRLVRSGYTLLNLISFFTTDGPEVRAWTVKRGSHAPQAAGKIHTDFEKGFIRAEVVKFNDLAKYGSVHAAREKGCFRTEGKDYVVQDGDVVHFKFGT